MVLVEHFENKQIKPYNIKDIFSDSEWIVDYFFNTENNIWE